MEGVAAVDHSPGYRISDRNKLALLLAAYSIHANGNGEPFRFGGEVLDTHANKVAHQINRGKGRSNGLQTESKYLPQRFMLFTMPSTA